MKSYRPEELFDEAGRSRRTSSARARRRRVGWARTRTLGGILSRPPTPGLSRLRGRGRQARRDAERGDRACSAGSCGTSSRSTRTRSGSSAQTRPHRTGLAPSSRPRPRPGSRRRRRSTSPRARRARDGGALGAPVPGLARGLPAHRPARALQLLRGVHPHRRLDVQPARQVAEGVARDPLAAPARLAQLPPELARLAAGPQRLLAPGSGLHRPRRQQEGRGHPRLPAAGRQLPALGRRSLPAQPALRERDRRREAADARLPLHGGGDRALHAGRRHLGVGLERRRRRAGRRPRLLRRRADARDSRRGRDPAGAPARTTRPRRERRRSDAAAARERASTRPLRPRLRRALHQEQAGRLRLPRLSVADPPADLPPNEPSQPARPRLQGGRYDHDAVRHGHAQRPRPLPPGHGRDRPRPRPRRARRRTCART